MPLKLIHVATAVTVVPIGVDASPINPFIWSDQTEDAVYLSQDLNKDGRVDGAGETTVFFGENTDSGLTDPAANVFTLSQSEDGDVFIGDGATDTVYRLRDLDGNGDAQGANEAQIWFSDENASGLSLNTPNGVSAGGDGAIYVVEADTRGNPSGDFVYRTEDLNGDGDANDIGEATVWLDLTALNASSSAFEIRFDGDTAYIADTVGGDPNVVYKARDEDGDGVVETNEVTTFIDEDNPFGIPVDFAIDEAGGSVYLWEFLDFSGTSSLLQLTDLDGSGSIDQPDEFLEVWNDDLLDPSYSQFVGFGMAVDDMTGDVVLMSNGSAENEDFLVYLSDVNGDGDFLDDGETFVPLARNDNGSLPVRPRNAEFYNAPPPIPLPAGLPLLVTGMAALAFLNRRHARKV